MQLTFSDSLAVSENFPAESKLLIQCRYLLVFADLFLDRAHGVPGRYLHLHLSATQGLDYDLERPLIIMCWGRYRILLCPLHFIPRVVVAVVVVLHCDQLVARGLLCLHVHLSQRWKHKNRRLRMLDHNLVTLFLLPERSAVGLDDIRGGYKWLCEVSCPEIRF